MHTTSLAAALTCVLITVPPLLGQNCIPYWAQMKLPSAIGGPSSLFTFDEGDGPHIYMGGSYELGPGEYIGGVFRREGTTWRHLNEGFPPYDPQTTTWYSGFVLDYGDGPKLMTVRGDITPKGNVPRMYVRERGRWNLYHQSFFSRPVNRLVSYDDGKGSRIYCAYDRFNNHTYVVAKWTGSEWIDLGQTPMSSSVEDMIVHDDGSGPALYISGKFQSIGGVPALNIARYTAAGWAPVGPGFPGLNNYPRALEVYDDGHGQALYTIGGLMTPEGNPGICKWDGSSWSMIGYTHAGPFSPYSVFDLGTFDDGSGMALYVGGTMPFVSGVEVRGLARWDGKAWSAPCSRISGVTHLASGPDARGSSLLAMGYFTNFAGGTVGQIAQLVGCPNCYADIDADGQLNVRDFTAFLNAFATGDPVANCTSDSDMTVADFLCYINRFAAGCGAR